MYRIFFKKNPNWDHTENGNAFEALSLEIILERKTTGYLD